MARTFYRYLAVLALSSVVSGQVSSYYPDGSLALDYDYRPCDNSTTYSASCYFGEGDQCLPYGLCYFPPQDGHHGNYIYRGACTDKSWTDTSCPELCVAETPNRYEALSYCPETGDFCCVKAVKGGDCCSQQQKRFQLTVDMEILTKLKMGGNATVSSSTGHAGTGDTLTNAGKDKKSSLSTGAAAGLGFGIAIAVVAICTALGYGYYRLLRRRRLHSRKTLSSSSDGDASDGGLEVARQMSDTYSVGPGVVLVSSNGESFIGSTSDKDHEISEGSHPQFSELLDQDAKQIDGTPKYPPEVDGKSLKELSAKKSTRSVRPSTDV